METWLSTDILDNEVAIPHYSLIRSDHNRHGVGVHCSILFNVLSGPPSLELIMVSLIKNSFKLCVFSIDHFQLVLTSLIICAKPYFLLTCPHFD